MIKQPHDVEQAALKYLQRHNIREGDIMFVLRRNFEMPAAQAVSVAERSLQGYTGQYLASIGELPMGGDR